MLPVRNIYLRASEPMLQLAAPCGGEWRAALGARHYHFLFRPTISIRFDPIRLNRTERA